MRRGMLLLVVLSAMIGSIAIVLAAPGFPSDASVVAAQAAPADVHGEMRVPRGAAPADAKPSSMSTAGMKESRIEQGLWTGLIDDFEDGAEPDPGKGWIYREDTNGDMFGEYYWGISDCRAASGQRSLWSIGDGKDGSKLPCGGPYPNGASSSIWLNLDTSHWATDTQKLDLLFDFWLNLRTFPEDDVEPDGLFVIYRLPKLDPAGGGETTEPVVLAAITAKNPNSFWHEPWRVDLMRAKEIYPQPDGSFREFNLAGKESVIIEFLFQSCMDCETQEVDGVFIDNVSLQSNVPGPDGTLTPTTPPTPETPTATPTITGTTTITPTTPAPTTETPTIETPTAETPTPTDTPTGTVGAIFLPLTLNGELGGPIDPPDPTEETPTAETPTLETPTAETPEPTQGPVECNDIVINGGFEDGPDVGWDMQSNATHPDGSPLGLSDLIVEYSSFEGQLVPPPGGGDWLAFLGDVLEVDMWLYQMDAVDTLPVDDVVSATLVINLGLLTDEEPDGEDNDFFGIYVMNQDDDAELVEEFSEESQKIQAGAWNEVTVPNFELLLTGRAGWETVRLAFRSHQDDEDLTQHALDNVTLEVCQIVSPAPSTSRQLRASQVIDASVRQLPGRLHR